MRLADRLTNDISRHKQRIRSLARMVMPMLHAAIPSEIADCDITLLARYGDPHRMVKAGRARLAKVLAGVAKAGVFNAERRAEAWLEVARAAIELYGLGPAVPFDAVALELASEAARWRLAEDELKRVTRIREQIYLRTDPEQLARSLPGIAKVRWSAARREHGPPGTLRASRAVPVLHRTDPTHQRHRPQRHARAPASAGSATAACATS